ncbi:MAG: response regulator receiver modulated CheW protein [Candidatus Magnetoglobus multicellularis str. Araruama]|uniref:Response regulator receiver modulated CheW protein n=1 Tax=Candidatus Magnetoglobus multicellularis str. Araruama TaxID=890399 RepID=A0A1V1P0U1_9BACT|nr:MAG: response regulator receiver modulated CheW protein [Candidatus Magnetoglobus multicellularis str. Araruama]
MDSQNENNYLKTKLLIVEDARAVRNLEVSMLKDMGFEIILEACDGQKAMDILKIEKNIGLVISDWNMPNKTGFDLLCWMRNDYAHKKTPFIMATGQGEKKKVMKAKKAGANNFVTKPFSPIEFKQVIDETLSVGKQALDQASKRNLSKTKSGKTRLKIAHIPITDHIVLGALKYLISIDELTPQHFELETERMLLWNPVQVALEKGDVDGVFILAPIAMDLFSFGIPIKLVLLAHKNGSICVRNKSDQTLTHKNDLKSFFYKKTFYLPHLLSVHHMLSTMFLRELGLNPGLSDNPKANTYFEVIPPIKMPDFQSKDKDVGGFMVAEPVGTKAIVTGVGDLTYLSSELWPNHPCCVIVLRDDVIEFDPDAIQEFVSMSVVAGQFVTQYPDIAAKVAVDFLDPDSNIGLKAPVIEKVLKNQGSIITDDLYPNINDLDRIQIYMREKMGIGTLIDMEKFVDLQFADIACKKAGVIQRPSIYPDPAKALSIVLDRMQHVPAKPVEQSDIKVSVKNINLVHHTYPNNNKPYQFIAHIYDTPEGCNIVILDIIVDRDKDEKQKIRSFLGDHITDQNDGIDLFSQLNNFLLDQKLTSQVKGLFARLNTKEMTGDIVSAASPPMILIRKYIPQPIKPRGRPLGADGSLVLNHKTFRLEPGNRLFFHTHGIKKKRHFHWLDDILLQNNKESFEIMVKMPGKR